MRTHHQLPATNFLREAGCPTQEIAVQFSVLAKTLRLALIGVTIGAVASFATSKVIASLLFKTEPSDPATFCGVLLLLVGVALLAGYLPALRATRVDPTTALRCE